MAFGGMGGASGGSGMGGIGSNIQNYQFLLQNLQALLAANPNYLTGGIPTKLLSQMWTEPAKLLQNYGVSF